LIFFQDRHLPLAILAGFATVTLALSPLAIPGLGLILSYFSTVPLFMIGLSAHRAYLPIAAAIAIVFMGILGGALSAIFFMLSQIIPLFLVVSLALKKEKKAWFPASTIVTILTASALLLMTLFFLWFLVVIKTPLEVETTLWLKGIIKEEKLSGALNETVGTIIPSLVAISWILTTIFNTLVGQRFLQAMGESLRPYPTKNDFDPVYTWDWNLVFFAGTLASLMKSLYPSLATFGLNAMLLAAVPLFLLGLRIFYLWLMQWQFTKAWGKILFFVILFFMFILVWPLLFIVGLGVLEPLLKLYPRLGK
jgi:hypothetical protein